MGIRPWVHTALIISTTQFTAQPRTAAATFSLLQSCTGCQQLGMTVHLWLRPAKNAGISCPKDPSVHEALKCIRLLKKKQTSVANGLTQELTVPVIH